MHIDTFEDYDDITQFPGLKRRDRHNGLEPRRKQSPRIDHLSDWLTSQQEGEDQLPISYGAGDNERLLLEDALMPFYRDNIITDVVARVKGGKEANVYCCRAHPNTGLDLIAAKVYRPRIHRTLRNDAIYKEGRLLLDQDSKGITRDARTKRAVAKKTGFGQNVITFSWIEYENTMLKEMYEAGADVPRPIGHVGSAILMQYFGEINRPAPTLNNVRLDVYEAEPMFRQLMRQVELMLEKRRVHGDLSPYNVLYWQGKAVVIDFPQAVVATKNTHARRLLHRDIKRLADYFGRYGVEADAAALTTEYWERFMDGDLG